MSMAEENNLKSNGTQSITMNVRLKSNGHGDQPILANYSNVGVAQGLAYVDFGFIEPPVVAAVMRRAQTGGELPKNLEGKLATRVALPLDAVLRLHQQLTQILTGLQKARGSKTS
jgi:hypothetical protein